MQTDNVVKKDEKAIAQAAEYLADLHSISKSIRPLPSWMLTTTNGDSYEDAMTQQKPQPRARRPSSRRYGVHRSALFIVIIVNNKKCFSAVLHSYIEQLLKKGLSIEFFIEGTRCRFGKSQLPKHGLISNVVKAVQERTISDCYLVPVSYTYDSVAEGVFLDELMGIPKDYMNALHEALSSRNVMPQLSRIPHTVSYRELVPWHAGHKEKPDDRSLIRAIGYHIVHEAQSIISISLVSVICSLLLCKFRQVGFFPYGHIRVCPLFAELLKLL
ncbi:hypothetical protein COOONC_05670 [Cooperia oncophora]